MPAKSKSQQRLFGMALAMKRGKKVKGASKKIKDISKKMSTKEIEKFASTEHEGLPESRAMSFSKFLNEAFIDDKGELKDFNFELDPDLQDEWEKKQSQTGDPKKGAKALFAYNFESFLSDSGAKNISSDLQNEVIMFSFNYDGGDYIVLFNPNEEYAEVIKQKIHDNNVVGLDQLYTGDSNELLTYFHQSGLNLLDQLK